jgi:hypothetical protein
VQRVRVFLCKNMQFTGQKAEQTASTACLLARKCHSLARKMAANMRNATCARTETSKLPTYVALLLFYMIFILWDWRVHNDFIIKFQSPCLVVV